MLTTLGLNLPPRRMRSPASAFALTVVLSCLFGPFRETKESINLIRLFYIDKATNPQPPEIKKSR